jgi:hypothetical protein
MERIKCSPLYHHLFNPGDRSSYFVRFAIEAWIKEGYREGVAFSPLDLELLMGKIIDELVKVNRAQGQQIKELFQKQTISALTIPYEQLSDEAREEIKEKTVESSEASQ